MTSTLKHRLLRLVVLSFLPMKVVLVLVLFHEHVVAKELLSPVQLLIWCFRLLEERFYLAAPVAHRKPLVRARNLVGAVILFCAPIRPYIDL